MLGYATQYRPAEGLFCFGLVKIGLVKIGLIKTRCNTCIGGRVWEVGLESLPLRDRVGQAMKEAMKARDELRLSALRMLRAAFLVKDKEGKGDVAEEELLGVVRSLIKQRHESAAAFRLANREESAAREEREAAILTEFLPPAMDETDLLTLVRAMVAECGATAPKDMGRVIKLVKEKSGGRADMSQVAEMVKSALSG